jgi:hypothetical protein
MQRVGSNRNPAVDKFGAGKNGFTAGDAQTGVPATTPGYEWFDAVQEELSNLVEGLGGAVDPTKHDQIKTLLLALLAQKASLAQLQSSGAITAVAGGTANALTATFAPAVTALANQALLVRAAAANTNATPTFAPDGVAAATIVKGNNLPLAPGDIAGAGHWLELTGDTTLGKWVLQNPATGVTQAKQIQPVTASVAANALTLGINPTTLDFRSAALASGTTNAAVSISAALSLTVPSGATLGTVSGQQAMLVLIAAYNGGTPVLCVANIAGGLDLSETGVISPTTISAGSTSASTIYSASAVSANSPYRVVGYVQVTEATAGTWATAPALVQGQGGQALAALQSFGYGQTLQNLTGSRSFGTTYYNTTSRPIFVEVAVYLGTGGMSVTFYKNGLAIATITNNTASTTWYSYSMAVLPGQSYNATLSSGGPSFSWYETR